MQAPKIFDKKDQLIGEKSAKLLRETNFRGSNYVNIVTGTRYTAEHLIIPKDSYPLETQTTVMRWLREIHGVSIGLAFYTDVNGKKLGWSAKVYLIEDLVASVYPNYSQKFSYEEAAELGIQRALKYIQK